MSDYKRITERNEGGYIKVICNKNCPHWSICQFSEIDCEDAVLDRLAELEDMMEQGELVSKEWHDEQVLHAEETIKEYIVVMASNMDDKQKQVEVNVGIQECKECKYKLRCEECKYKLRCEECVYNEKDISKLLDQARKETAREIIQELAFAPLGLLDGTIVHLAEKYNVDISGGTR